METFPRKGVELSTDCELRFVASSHIRPAIVVRFENGSREARFRTSKGMKSFTAIFVGSGDDFGAMTDFIEAHGVVTSFTIVHPDFGTGVGNLRNTEHPIEKVVSGELSWFRMEIPIEAAF
jgi:hypothetical protein